MPAPVYVHPDDAAEMQAAWPKFTLQQIADRWGYSFKVTRRVVHQTRKLDLRSYRAHVAELSQLGVRARCRKQAQQKFEEAIFRSRLLLPLF